MESLIHISVGNAAITALLGYVVVFIGLILLMLVVMILGAVMKRKAAPVVLTTPPVPEAARAASPPAVGTAGELKLYDTDPRDAAMIMAIVADTLGKPLNELRFISIKEVTKDEI